MNTNTQIIIKSLWLIIILFLVFFLLFPLSKIFLQAFYENGSLNFSYFTEILADKRFYTALKNSLNVSLISAFTATVLAFIVAYTIHFTHLHASFKKILSILILVPMLLPTLTYGFAIIYTFGKLGLVTKIFGEQLFENIYGFYGMWLGYTIYTLPIAFILLNNTFYYIDKRYLIVSKLMGDSFWKSINIAVLKPIFITFCAAIIQTFFLAFSDYGIPASIGGRYEVLAIQLYDYMLGSLPSFEKGSIIAIAMLIPSVLSIWILSYLKKYNIRYDNIQMIELPQNRWHDAIFTTLSSAIVLSIIFIFSVIFIVPWFKSWPYVLTFDSYTVIDVLTTPNLMMIYNNSLKVAGITAIIGTLVVYLSSILNERSNLNKVSKSILDMLAIITNTIPGMVLGIAYLLAFSGSTMVGGLTIIIISNIVHFYSTPYIMGKSTLAKMNSKWEMTAELMGDSWFKTLRKILIPNSLPSLIEIFSYFFINAMVTISAVIFLTGPNNMVLTAKIKELQYFAKFDQIFVLSMLIFFTNIAMLLIIMLMRKLIKKKIIVNNPTN